MNSPQIFCEYRRIPGSSELSFAPQHRLGLRKNRFQIYKRMWRKIWTSRSRLASVPPPSDVRFIRKCPRNAESLTSILLSPRNRGIHSLIAQQKPGIEFGSHRRSYKLDNSIHGTVLRVICTELRDPSAILYRVGALNSGWGARHHGSHSNSGVRVLHASAQ